VNLAVGQSATFTVAYTVTLADLDTGVIDNSATASGTPPNSSTPVKSTPATASVKTVKPNAAGAANSAGTVASSLPYTGAPLAQEAGGGALLVVLGSGLLLAVARRRRRTA